MQKPTAIEDSWSKEFDEEFVTGIHGDVRVQLKSFIHKVASEAYERGLKQEKIKSEAEIDSAYADGFADGEKKGISTGFEAFQQGATKGIDDMKPKMVAMMQEEYELGKKEGVASERARILAALPEFDDGINRSTKLPHYLGWNKGVTAGWSECLQVIKTSLTGNEDV